MMTRQSVLAADLVPRVAVFGSAQLLQVEYLAS
jgi:hypothetical protein